MHKTRSSGPIEGVNGAASGDAVVEATPDRLAEPVGPEVKPRLPFTVVGVGASAGGLEAYTEFLHGCKADAGFAYVLIQHLSPTHNSIMAELLSNHTTMPVRQVEEGLEVQPNHVYVIRPGFTVTIRDGRLHLGENAAERMNRRPVDDFFKSLAEEQRERAVAIILSGTGSNGTLGCESIKAVGGFVIAQDPESAKFPSMPRSLIESNLADVILQPAEMFAVIRRYATHSYSKGEEPSLETMERGERRALSEMVTILRTRTRHDFSVYKKPTLIRRVQRRMSLLQLDLMSDYVRALRQTPSEVTALADDLMIHVTGFFRDPEVWESLKNRVIQPLVDSKPDSGLIRCWVTACSSGEEAYTIGMLLMEAAEAAGKHFDIKIFATDTAERSLIQARAGVFPGGIESEITPERLSRFFDKDDAFYRVKKDLRELVVFAPQNVLQDPPFSRLDVCTCRNLLIYIEGDTQRRILSMLHFGLREGGTLVLGNSETITGAEDLFEPIDKPHRIYRRIGPTRHGSMSFPIPLAVARPRATNGAEDTSGDESMLLARTTIAQLATKALLDDYTPAAVVVDRTGQIVHFHGRTQDFLRQPPGEPTRELLALTRDEIRGGVRTVLQRSMSNGELERHRDGYLGEGPLRQRVEVSAAPLAGNFGSHYFLVSFGLHSEPPTIASDTEEGVDAEVADELRRARDELQSTIEELQTSNEEMKASHEEVTSVNEELQSSNEELETSKEELQSLNEELTTVNAQLHAKMEELERMTNDLASLLSSTDIAVIFLDTQFRIRRFTPATRELIELIPNDIGRPLKDLASKFDDEMLISDAQQVLERLVPVEREMLAHNRRLYVRRVLPYRTTDNRIDGVVVTFLDVTELHRAEVELRHQHLVLSLAADATNAGWGTWDWKTGVAQWSTNGKRIMGFETEAEARSVDGWLARIHPEDREKVKAHVGQAAADHRDFDIEYRVVHDNGQIRNVLGRGRILYDELNQPLQSTGMVIDITDRVLAEEAVRSSEQRQAFLLTLSDALRPLADPVAVQAASTHVLREQMKVDRVLYGELSDDGTTFRVGADDCALGVVSVAGEHAVSSFGRDFAESLLSGRAVAVGNVDLIPHLTSEERSAYTPIQVVAYAAVPLLKGGRLAAFLAVQHSTPREWNVTDLKLIEDVAERTWAAVEQAKAEAALRGADALYRVTAANLPNAAVFVVGRDLRYRLAVGQALHQMGRSSEDYEGKTVREADPPDEADERERNYRAALAGDSFRVEHEIADRTFVSHGVPLYHSGGDIDAVLVVSYDVTDLRRVDNELRIREAELRTLADVVPDLLWRSEPDASTTWLNRRWLDYTGQTLAEASGWGWLDAIHPADRERSAAIYRGGVETKTEVYYEHRIRRHDGAYRWFLVQGGPLLDEAGNLIWFFGAATDIHEQREALEQMASAKEIAEAASQAKDEFLATLSHELRTPLSAILIWSKLLRTVESAEHFEEGMEAIQNSAEAQKRLIEDLLDSARITSGKLRMEMEPTDLAAVMKSAVDSIRPTAEGKQLTLKASYGSDVGVVIADPERLRQIVWNLLSNSVKFTPEGGQITISLTKREEDVQIKVEDTGRGIAPDFLPYVFERFRQEDSAITRRTGGLGLGLAIVRQLVEIHDGRVTAESAGVGKGATFTVSLPLPRQRR